LATIVPGVNRAGWARVVEIREAVGVPVNGVPHEEQKRLEGVTGLEQTEHWTIREE
jgi:hypothetical protein